MTAALTNAGETPAAESDALDRVDEAIRLVLSIERSVPDALSRARFALEDAERENIALRRQLLEAKLEFFTREEFAERLKISVDTLDELLKTKKIPHLNYSPRMKRFTSVHLVEVARLLEVKAGPARIRRAA